MTWMMVVMMAVKVVMAVVVVVESRSWRSMLTVWSRSWRSMLTVVMGRSGVEVAMVKRDTSNSAGHRRMIPHNHVVRTTPSTPMHPKTCLSNPSQSSCPILRCPR